ncbi:MAG: ketosteroid isomerase-like protein [Candidatus Poriferisodalaceae bacterium]|jgi:ketosteroid isomerase-like protein
MEQQTIHDGTLDSYYLAWANRDHDLYRTLWTEDATIADPPTDGVTPPTGVDEILAGMEEVWARAQSITYTRHTTWHCGSVLACHLTVTMLSNGAELTVPLIHVFRLQGDRIARLEAFLDLDLAEVVSGNRPDWLPA